MSLFEWVHSPAIYVLILVLVLVGKLALGISPVMGLESCFSPFWNEPGEPGFLSCVIISTHPCIEYSSI